MGNEERERVPRHRHTPISVAGTSIQTAWAFWDWLVGSAVADNPGSDYGELNDREGFFAEEIFGKAWKDPETNGDKFLDDIRLSLDGSGDSDPAPYGLLLILETVIAYAVQAMKAENAGSHEDAWAYASDASYWAGVLAANHAEKLNGTRPAAELARRRHAENYALADEAIEYWRKKIDPKLSANKAANELIAVVPLSHKKLAELVSKAKKGNA